VLLTTFAGGRRNQEIMAVHDDFIDWSVREELEWLIGTPEQALWQQIMRRPQAIPQYTIGHLGRIGEVEAAEFAIPGLHFCGSYRGGMSVGDCIKSAHMTAEKIDRSLRR